MTTPEFLTIRGALLSASILLERDLAKATSVQETRFLRRITGKIDAGLRTIDALAGERTDLPKTKQQLTLLTDTAASSQSHPRAALRVKEVH